MPTQDLQAVSLSVMLPTKIVCRGSCHHVDPAPNQGFRPNTTTYSKPVREISTLGRCQQGEEKHPRAPVLSPPARLKMGMNFIRIFAHLSHRRRNILAKSTISNLDGGVLCYTPSVQQKISYIFLKLDICV
jgi:hypothetical protein